MGSRQQNEFQNLLENHTNQEEWNNFYNDKGEGPFECYGDWSHLVNLLRENLLWSFSDIDKSADERKPAKEKLRILVPGCGISRLSEYLYDSGFQDIVNVDFSKAAIRTMMMRNVRQRPKMFWRHRDITDLRSNDVLSEFLPSTFDIVVDKGGLDALMEAEIGQSLLIADLLLNKFRYSWDWRIHYIPDMQCFMIIMQKGSPWQGFMVVKCKGLSHIDIDVSSWSEESVKVFRNMASKFRKQIENEARMAIKYVNNQEDVVYKLEDLKLKAAGNISELKPGRRIKVILDETGESGVSYHSVLLDAKHSGEEFKDQYLVVVVPQESKTRRGIFEDEEEQWNFFSNFKASRLLLVMLDYFPSESFSSINDIKKDIIPQAMYLTPAAHGNPKVKPNFMVYDGIWHRENLYEGTSGLTSSILVDNVIYKTHADEDPRKDREYRRLTFVRHGSLLKSEAPLSIEESVEAERETKHKASSSGEKEKEAEQASSVDIEKDASQEAPVKTEKESQKEASIDTEIEAKQEALEWTALSDEMEVDHSFLASPYHNAILDNIELFYSHSSLLSTGPVKAVILGLGEGALPMLLKKKLPFNLKIWVFELDRAVVNVARQYYGFKEADNLKVYISDGIEAIKNLAAFEQAAKPDIVIVNVDSTDTSSGLSCPGEGYVANSFLWTVKESLSEDGMFIMNLVSRSSPLKVQVYSRLKEVFSHVIQEIKNDVSEVLIALKMKEAKKAHNLPRQFRLVP